MKNSTILSAILGGTFFAIPYLGLSVGLLPSLAIGIGAFGAGELLLRGEKKETEAPRESLVEMLAEAREKNKQIGRIATQIEDKEMIEEIVQIQDSITKIIEAVEKKPEKYKKVDHFFDYYVPVTLRILHRYDEIENQKLTSQEGKTFMENTESMVKKINQAFKKQLSNVYQSDMIDTDAEMKVFENMLKSDGFDVENDFQTK